MELRWLPASAEDVFYAFPLFAVAFLCHFNVLPIHAELLQPTRKRLSRVFQLTMAICSVFYTGTQSTNTKHTSFPLLTRAP